jgi:hypothetical protein
MRKPRTALPAASLQFEYIRHAAFFYFRAVGPEENLVSAGERQLAGAARRMLEEYGIAVPSPGEVYGYAQDKWKPHQLHTGPGAAPGVAQ